MQSLRPFQERALAALQDHSHVAVSAPTGSGKSLIYELAARRFTNRSVLVTPLQALGVQQFSRLHAAIQGERPLTVSLGLAVHARDQRGPPTLGRGGSGIWIISPEMLLTAQWQDRLSRFDPELWIIDEAHCVWEWGTRFRPAYGALLDRFRRSRPQRSLWLSATFPPQGLEELRTLFGDYLQIQGHFALPAHLRLIWEQTKDDQRVSRLLHWLRVLADQPPQRSGVVFVSSRNAATRVTRLIHAAGFPATIYHAGLSPEIRRATEASLRRDPVAPRILVATSAFGMGMDLDFLDWGIFWEVPYGALDLAQRVGRVGRGDQNSRPTIVALWSPAQLIQRADAHLTHLLKTNRCRRKLLAEIFEVPAVPASGDCCDICMRENTP